eukprot:g9831.t1
MTGTTKSASSSVLSPDGAHLLATFRRNQFKVYSSSTQAALFAHTDATEVYKSSSAASASSAATSNLTWAKIGARDILVLPCSSGNIQLWSFAHGKCELLGTVTEVFSVGDGALVSKHAATIHECTSLQLVGSRILAGDSSETITVFDAEDAAFASSLTTGKQTPLKSLVLVSAAAGEDAASSSSSSLVLSLRAFADAAAVVATGTGVQPSFLTLSDIFQKQQGDIFSSLTAAAASRKRKANDDEEIADANEPGSKKAGKAAKIQVTNAVKCAKASATVVSTLDPATEKYMDDLERQIETNKVEKKNAPAGVVSLAPLLKQYLKSQDATVLATCLSQVDKKVIQRSCQELAGKEAFSWFFECQRFLFTQPGKASLVTEWMRQVLTAHCSYLLTNPELREQLQPLYRSLDERLQASESLQRIQGKLDLLLSTAKDRVESTRTEMEPLRKFEEGESDEEDGDADAGEESTESGLDEEELRQMMADDDFDPDAMEDLM